MCSPTASLAKGGRLYCAVVEADLEGIAAKHLADPYHLKILNRDTRSDAVVANGFASGKVARPDRARVAELAAQTRIRITKYPPNRG